MKQQMETVWRERAHRLSQRPEFAKAEHNALPFIVLGIGKERYGIELYEVAEVLPPVSITPVPGAPAVFTGVINVHGEIRPVIDLRTLLGMPAAEMEPQNVRMARVILLRRQGREMGLRIESVEQIRWIGSGDWQASRNGDSGLSPHIKGSTKDQLLLLSTEGLFAELDKGVED